MTHITIENNISTLTPPYPWEGVSLTEWNSWKWQLSNRLNSLEDFSAFLNLSEDEAKGLSTQGFFRVDVTPYFASLMDPDDPNCPIRKQVIPTYQETQPFNSALVDSLGEDKHSPVPGLVHRYPDRVLLMTTTQCASYCRFCTRSRIVGDPKENFGTDDLDRQIEYISSNPDVRDVLLSGGDPLILPLKRLETILERVSSIPHVEVVRINTRVPVFLPQMVTDELVAVLKRFPPMWVNLNLNHAKEITPELEIALSKMANAGIPLGSQTVLMAGVNDCPNIILELVQKCVKNRVRPYYLYQCDLVTGAGHFRTPVSKGIEIIEALRGHTSGYAIPTFVLDAPDGGGKVPLQPNYLISQGENKVVVRNYEGFISTYTEPTNYESHNSSNCSACQSADAGKGKTSGVSALLAGKARTIKPENWEHNHSR